MGKLGLVRGDGVKDTCLRWFLSVQKVDVAFEEMDQMDVDANAGVKGVEAEPQQPQLVAARELVSAASRFVVLVDVNNVRVFDLLGILDQGCD